MPTEPIMYPRVENVKNTVIDPPAIRNAEPQRWVISFLVQFNFSAVFEISLL